MPIMAQVKKEYQDHYPHRETPGEIIQIVFNTDQLYLDCIVRFKTGEREPFALHELEIEGGIGGLLKDAQYALKDAVEFSTKGRE